LAIAPYKDRGHKAGALSEERVSSVGTADPESSASGDLFAHAQGVSLKTFKDNRCRLLPMVSANGFKNDFVDEKFYSFAGGDPVISHEMRPSEFGYVQEFIFYSRDGASLDSKFTPYDDIFSLRKSSDAVAFLKDDGSVAYPQTVQSPSFLNPGMMNGIIEPLSVRGTLPGSSAEAPFVAHTVRASIDTEKGAVNQYVRGYTQNRDRTTAFVDSQDTLLSSGDFKLSVEGISDFGTEAVSSFDDNQEQMSIDNDLKSQNESTFNDFIGVGIISKMSVTTMFNFEPNRSVSRGMTGIRNASSVDSLAFGGLIK
jgi:hypothetical protein